MGDITAEAPEEFEMGDIQKNLAAASLGVNLAVALLKKGSDDRGMWEHFWAGPCVQSLKEEINKADEVMKAGGVSKLARIQMWAKKAMEAGCGNCGELAAVAFWQLLILGYFPLDLCYIGEPKPTHNLVLIGRNEGSVKDFSTWGPETAVCDPWTRRSYEGKDWPWPKVAPVGVFYRQPGRWRGEM